MVGAALAALDLRHIVCRNEEEAENDRKEREATVASLDAHLKNGEDGGQLRLPALMVGRSTRPNWRPARQYVTVIVS